jgi:hypothetical protein
VGGLALGGPKLQLAESGRTFPAQVPPCCTFGTSHKAF